MAIPCPWLEHKAEIQPIFVVSTIDEYHGWSIENQIFACKMHVTTSSLCTCCFELSLCLHVVEQFGVEAEGGAALSLAKRDPAAVAAAATRGLYV